MSCLVAWAPPASAASVHGDGGEQPPLCLCCCSSCMQSSSGAASTMERLTKETDTNISQVHGDVTSKKNLVGGAHDAGLGCGRQRPPAAAAWLEQDSCRHVFWGLSAYANTRGLGAWYPAALLAGSSHLTTHVVCSSLRCALSCCAVLCRLLTCWSSM